MKEDLKETVKEFLVVPMFSYFDKHRRQGRIFFRGLICSLQLFAIIYALIYAIITGIGSVIILKGYFLDIISKLTKLTNDCNLI
jgi:hypothetical protein